MEPIDSNHHCRKRVIAYAKTARLTNCQHVRSAVVSNEVRGPMTGAVRRDRDGPSDDHARCPLIEHLTTTLIRLKHRARLVIVPLTAGGATGQGLLVRWTQTP